MPASTPQDQPTYVQPTYVQPTYVQPTYADPAYGPGLPPVAPAAAPRDWTRHPGTWVIAATVLLVAGIVLAAVIVASGGSDDKTDRAAGSASTSTSQSSTPIAPPSTPTQTVLVVPAAPGSPAVTQTVTIEPDRPTLPESGSGRFAGADEVDASYFQRGNTVYFDSPSHNIGCRLVVGGAQAQCTISDYSFSEPGYDCDLGAGVLMNAYSSPVIDCINTSPYSGGPVLEYGESVTFGNFSCVSRENGVTCVDDYGSGFSLSREAYTAY